MHILQLYAVLDLCFGTTTPGGFPYANTFAVDKEKLPQRNPTMNETGKKSVSWVANYSSLCLQPSSLVMHTALYVRPCWTDDLIASTQSTVWESTNEDIRKLPICYYELSWSENASKRW